jgi:hypothetical protein
MIKRLRPGCEAETTYASNRRGTNFEKLSAAVGCELFIAHVIGSNKLSF